MMAGNEDRQAVRSRGAPGPGLALLLVLITLCFISNDWLAARAISWQAATWHGPLAALVSNLVIMGAIALLSRLQRSRGRAVLLLMLLALVALMGFGAAVGVLQRQLHVGAPVQSWHFQAAWQLASNFLIGLAAIACLLWLKPWRGWEITEEPVSPSTRKAKNLLGLAMLIMLPGTLLLYYGAFSKEHPAAMFSNSPIPLWIAVVAIACWLLSQAINKWWWYFSADEHEQRADDFGNLLGWALFLIVTPAWWIAARAGLLPHMDAMVLWIVAVSVSALGYFWRRHH